MASNQPHSKRDVGGQGAKGDKSKDAKTGKQPPAPNGSRPKVPVGKK